MCQIEALLRGAGWRILHTECCLEPLSPKTVGIRKYFVERINPYAAGAANAASQMILCQLAAIDGPDAKTASSSSFAQSMLARRPRRTI